MNKMKKSFSKIPTESVLIGILHLIGLLSLYSDADQKRGRPYVYPTTIILRCFVVRIWFRIPSNNALHYFLSIDTAFYRRIIKSCGLHHIPARRTFDRRLRSFQSARSLQTWDCTSSQKILSTHPKTLQYIMIDAMLRNAR